MTGCTMRKVGPKMAMVERSDDGASEIAESEIDQQIEILLQKYLSGESTDSDESLYHDLVQRRFKLMSVTPSFKPRVTTVSRRRILEPS